MCRLFFFPEGIAPRFQDAFNLIHIGIADALTAAVAATQAVEDVLPHGPGRLQLALPGPAAFQLPAEPPHAGKPFRAQEAALTGRRVAVGPLDFHNSRRPPPSLPRCWP